MFDADYRVELMRFSEHTIHERFKDCGLGSAEAPARVTAPDFANAVTPAAAGCEVIYPEANYPTNYHLPSERISELVPPTSLLDLFPYSEIVSQVRYLNRQLGMDETPAFHLRGVLNDASLIQGSSFFEDLYNDPAAARHLLDYTAGIANAAAEHNIADFKNTQTLWIANCTAMMAGPRNYATWQLPYDQQLAEFITISGREFGVHHCGVFDDYILAYRSIPRVSWIELGWQSDLHLALTAFPEAVIQYVISPTFMASATSDEVTACLEDLLDQAGGELHRLRISLPDIESGTPDSNIVAAIEACSATPALVGGAC